MCVISCIFNYKDNFTKNHEKHSGLVSAMNRAACRESAECWIGEYAALAYSGSGRQPLSKICEGYQFVILFCGELFEKEPLRTLLSSCGYVFSDGSDAELALNCYIHFGHKCTEKLCGHFSFIVYDTMRRRIFAACDNYGAVPLFYRRTGDGMLISSEIRSITAHPEVRAELDSDGICELLRFSKNGGDVLKGIKRLPGGHFLEIKNDDLKICRCYSPEPEKNTDTYKTALGEIDSMLKKSVAEEAAAPCGIFLSGCPCDDLMCAVMAEQTRGEMPVSTYSFADCRDVVRAENTLHRQISYDEMQLLEGLKKSVSVCGLPVISGTDFLLPILFEKVPSDERNMLFSLYSCGIFSKPRAAYDVAVRNHAFNPAVEKTLTFEKEPDESNGFLNSCAMLAAEYGIKPKFPLLRREIIEYAANLPYSPSLIFRELSSRYTGCARTRAGSFNTGLLGSLRRILLAMTEEKSCPVLAFFDREAIFRLCTGGFDFSGSDITPVEFISYIIKLNLWFLEYRPIIL